MQNNEQALNDEAREALELMMADVKRKMKPLSKNELIRTICALLVDNYTLKVELQAVKSADMIAEGP